MKERSLALIADDVEMNRDLLSVIIGDTFETVEAENGDEALEIINTRADELAVVLLDLVMPKKHGLEVLAAMQESGKNKQIPVLIISGESDHEVEAKCFRLGAFDFVHKPFDPYLVKHRLENATAFFKYKNHLEERVEEQTAQLAEQNARLEQVNRQIIELLGNVVEARNLESGQHVKRVKLYSRMLAECYMREYPDCGLTPHIIDIITSASALHDVGKITIPDNILLKPGRLTPEEFAIMKEHSAKGAELVREGLDLFDEEINSISYAICRWHHEKWDGRGYPDGLKGDEIPLSAQIVSVADCFDALTTERPYKKAFTAEKAYSMITGGECGAFSDKLMHCFILCRDMFEKQAIVNQ